jgi:hypothetical protein
LLKEDDLDAHLLDVEAKDDGLKEGDEDVNDLMGVVHVIDHVVPLGDAIGGLDALDNKPKH